MSDEATQATAQRFSPALETALSRMVPGVESREEAMSVVVVAGLARPEALPEIGVGFEDVVDILTKSDTIDRPFSFVGDGSAGVLASNLSKNSRLLHLLPSLTQDTALFELAVAGSKDINASSVVGTLGHTLAHVGTIEQLNVALRYGLDPTALNPSGFTMADVAEREERPEMAAALRAARADWEAVHGAKEVVVPSANLLEDSLRQMETLGMTRSEALSTSLLDAANRGRFAQMDELFALGASTNAPVRMGLFNAQVPLDDPDAQTNTLLLAAMTPTMPPTSLAYLCAKSPNVNEMIGDMTPLMGAAAFGTKQHVTVLLAAKADPNVRNSLDETAIGMARSANNVGALEALEEGRRTSLRSRAQELARESLAGRADAPVQQAAPAVRPAARGDERG